LHRRSLRRHFQTAAFLLERMGEWPVSVASLSDPVLSARAQKISRRAYWLSDPDLCQHSHAGLNKGEASNSVRRGVLPSPWRDP
jgi:TnpA family transposase